MTPDPKRRSTPLDADAVEDRIGEVLAGRQVATAALERTLEWVLTSPEPVSEVAFRDRWLSDMRSHSSILRDGWYDPPEQGTAVLFATSVAPARVNFENLRAWPPRNDVFLDRSDALMYLYASPVAARTGMIGDVGVTLYVGSDEGIQRQLRMSLEVNLATFDHVSVGSSTFADAFRYADEVIDQHGMTNVCLSVTDPGSSNIGHTVPHLEDGWPEEQLDQIREHAAGPTLIRHARVLVSAEADRFVIMPGSAFTIEPRPTAGAVMTSFHTIALVHADGQKELITGFDHLFELAGMRYMSAVAPVPQSEVVIDVRGQNLGRRDSGLV